MNEQQWQDILAAIKPVFAQWEQEYLKAREDKHSSEYRLARTKLDVFSAFKNLVANEAAQQEQTR